jgi:hypothetical protein
LRVPRHTYRVELATGAWRQVASLDRTAFKTLMEALKDVAVDAPTAEGDRTRRMTAGELTAVFEVDHPTGTVLVLDIVRSTPE